MNDATTEAGAGDMPAPAWPEDNGRCDGCAKTKDRVITRINRTPRVKLCDACFEETKR